MKQKRCMPKCALELFLCDTNLVIPGSRVLVRGFTYCLLNAIDIGREVTKSAPPGGAPVNLNVNYQLGTPVEPVVLHPGIYGTIELSKEQPFGPCL